MIKNTQSVICNIIYDHCKIEHQHTLHCQLRVVKLADDVNNVKIALQRHCDL